MWKSYKAFMKKSDRLQSGLLYPACCICCYAGLLWYCAPGLKTGEFIDFFDPFVNIWIILPGIAYFFTDYWALGEVFQKKKENLYFLRRSCKGRQVLLNAVKMDFLFRLGCLALSFGGMVIAELLIGARYRFSFRSLIAQGYFWLSGVVICFSAVTLVVTLSRVFPGYLKGILFLYLGFLLEAFLSILVTKHFVVLPCLMVLSALLVAGNLELTKRRWKEGVQDEKHD